MRMWRPWARKRRKPKPKPEPEARVSTAKVEKTPKGNEGLGGFVEAGKDGPLGEATNPISLSELPVAQVLGKPEGDQDHWFSESEVAALARAKSGADLSARIGSLMPDCCREEQLFRYQLSRAVFLEEFDLPVLPQSATGVMALARNVRASTADYVQLIEPDASLAQEVLARTNSSLYAGRDPIVALPQAVARLGIREIERVALVHTLRSRLFRVSGFDDLLASLIDHNLATSFAAQFVASSTKAAVEDASLAGLFHDVGKLVLLNIMGTVQHKLRWKASKALVQSTFEAFHVRVGELACSRWEFPDEIVKAVACHHDAERARESVLASVLYSANIIVKVIAAESADADEDSTLMSISGDQLLLETLGGRDGARKVLGQLRRLLAERRPTPEHA